MMTMTDYTCDRVLMDIFQIALEMRDAGFAVKLEIGGMDAELQNTLLVDVWASPSEKNCFGRAEEAGEIEAVISSYYGHHNDSGRCWFDYDDFDCLHKLYDSMHALLLERKGAPEINF